MKVSVTNQFTSLDPLDIQELCKGEVDRHNRRMEILRNFMYWAYFKESKRWTQINNEEKIIVKRQFWYAHLLVGFGVFANAAIYNAFMIGIYNFRTYEVMQMRAVPFPLKLALSSLVAGFMSRQLYFRQIYEPDLYRVALKYRSEFDSEYIRRTQEASEPL